MPKTVMKKIITIGMIALLAVLLLLAGRYLMKSNDTPKEDASENSYKTSSVMARHIKKPDFVRGIHLAGWVAGSRKRRERFYRLFRETELNTVVIAVKEYKGEVYLPGVKEAEDAGNFVNAMPDIEDYLKELKELGVYTSARIVVFKDDALAKKNPHLAVKDPDGNVWKDRRGNSWTDPYNRDVWDYNLSIAERAFLIGFDEIQFDYIRFPSDGNTRLCRYSVKHTSITAIGAMQDFLKESHRRLKPLGADISICVFGLTTTVSHDMGIGQRIIEMSEVIDAVCPMVYPSHYNPGEYGLENPNAMPYLTVYHSISGAVRRPGEMSNKIRPYLQDFSLGHKYGPEEVRAQIQACYDAGVYQWLLWDPNCRYSVDALHSKEEYNLFVSSITKYGVLQ